MIKSKTYTIKTMTTNIVADNQMYSILALWKEEDTDSDSDNILFEYIEKDGNYYLINNNTKSLDNASDLYSEDDVSLSTDGNLVYDNLQYIGKGNEDFLGNKRPYEEYIGDLGKVKYYFDGNKLYGIEMILNEDEDDETSEHSEEILIVEVLSYEKDADMSVFDLIKDYEVRKD